VVSPATAGLHLSLESFRELPSDWRGFLPDLRALRSVADSTAVSSPYRDTYAHAASKLESLAKTRPLTADELADLGGLWVRLGEPARAVAVLRPAARQHPDHFRILANLGTAWQLAGDLVQAAAALDDAVRLAPDRFKPAERLHLRLVRSRQQVPEPSDGDRLVDSPSAEELARLQQLALWLPADGRLLWQLGELAHALGDDRTAANILDGCVTEFGLRAEVLLRHRQAYRAAADQAERIGHRQNTIPFRSSRPLARSFDPARLPAVRPEGVHPLPWPALTETEVSRGFQITVLPYVEQLDGKQVVLTGYPAPGGSGFLLTEFPIGCWFCDSPGPTRVVAVDAAPPPGRDAVKVTGTFRLNRTDPERYLFEMTDVTIRVTD
jgi:hypothetical protein